MMDNETDQKQIRHLQRLERAGAVRLRLLASLDILRNNTNFLGLIKDKARCKRISKKIKQYDELLTYLKNRSI